MYQSPSFLLRRIKDNFFLEMLLIISVIFVPYFPNQYFESIKVFEVRETALLKRQF